MASEGMFQLDADGDAVSSEVSDPVASGTITPTSVRAKSEVELSRKAIPLLEVEKDVCSICLDEFVEEDPGIPLSHCGHQYHLQCIFEWSKRSRECPLCFHTLELKDPALNELLPFGEYVSPQQAAASASALESWDLERLLVQLAAANQRQERRAAREAARLRRRTSAVAGGGSEASAPQPIRHTTSDVAAAARRHSMEAGASSSAANGLAHVGSPGAPDSGHTPTTPAGAFPASWPPAGSRMLAGRGGDEGAGSSGGGGGGSRGQGGPLISPSLKAASQSIKKGFAALKIRESFSKTEAKLKAMFSHSDRRPDRPAAGS